MYAFRIAHLSIAVIAVPTDDRMIVRHSLRETNAVVDLGVQDSAHLHHTQLSVRTFNSGDSTMRDDCYNTPNFSSSSEAS